MLKELNACGGLLLFDVTGILPMQDPARYSCSFSFLLTTFTTVVKIMGSAVWCFKVATPMTDPCNWYISLQEWLKDYGTLVGKYSMTMDPSWDIVFTCFLRVRI